MKKTISMISQEFVNEETNQTVEGVTIIIDGFFKEVVNVLRHKNPHYQTNLELINDALMKGLAVIRDEKNN